MELFKGQIKDFDITQFPSNDGKNFRMNLNYNL